MANAITEVDSQILDCQIDIESMNNTIKELEVEKFENLAEYFDDSIDVLDNTNTMLEKEISLLEESGQIVDESLYEAQITNEEQKLALLKHKQEVLTTQLANSLSSGIIEKGSEEWHEMNDDINEVNEAIVDSKINIEELNNAITQLEIDKFERIEEHFDKINEALDHSSNMLQKYISLFEESGESVDSSIYETLIENEEKRIIGLINEKSQLQNQLNESVSSGKIKEGSDEWNELNNKIKEVDGAILDCQINIEGFKNSITKDEVGKFEKIKNHFDDLNGVIDNSSESIQDQIDLLEKSGETIDSSMYEALIKNEENKMSFLKQEKEKLENQLNESVESGKIEVGSDEWKKMKETIKEVDGAISDCQINIEGFKNSIAEGEVDKFEKIKNHFDELSDVLDNSNESIQDQIDLLEKSGKAIDSSLYTTQIANEEKKLAFLEQKKEKLENQLEESVNSGKIKEGSEEWEEMVEAIKDVDSSIMDCKISMEELNNIITQLEVDKFEKIAEHFQNLTDVLDNSNSLIQKQIGLLEESGEIVGKAYYTAQIENEQNKLSFLEKKKVDLTKRLNEAVSSGNVKEGSEEWLNMKKEIENTDSAILDCKTTIEGLNNTLLDLDWQTFERIQETLSNLNSELENLIGLFDDVDIADEKGVWTKEGIAQLGILAQQYELALYQSEQYKKEIEKLNKDYKAGKYSATEYSERLAELNQKQWDCVNSAEAIKDSIIKTHEARVNQTIKGIEKEKEAYSDLIEKQIESLDKEKD